jgi:hypothetical protein
VAIRPQIIFAAFTHTLFVAWLYTKHTVVTAFLQLGGLLHENCINMTKKVALERYSVFTANKYSTSISSEFDNTSEVQFFLPNK